MSSILSKSLITSQFSSLDTFLKSTGSKFDKSLGVLYIYVSRRGKWVLREGFGENWVL